MQELLGAQPASATAPQHAAMGWAAFPRQLLNINSNQEKLLQEWKYGSDVETALTPLLETVVWT